MRKTERQLGIPQKALKSCVLSLGFLFTLEKNTSLQIPVHVDCQVLHRNRAEGMWASMKHLKVTALYNKVKWSHFLHALSNVNNSERELETDGANIFFFSFKQCHSNNWGLTQGSTGHQSNMRMTFLPTFQYSFFLKKEKIPVNISNAV